MSYIGRQLNNLSDRVKLDSITASATATYNLLLNTVAYVPSSAESLTVSLNGVIQAPQDSYTVSGSQITFASALTSSDSIDFILAERSITLQTPSAGSVGTSQLASDAVNGDKIADDSISDEHLDITAITGQTAITSLADTDKFLVSDASDSGNLKYVEKQYLPSGTHVLLNSSDATGLSDITFDNFSSTYNKYRILGSHSMGTNNAQTRFRMRKSGSDQTGSNYRYAYVTVYKNSSGSAAVGENTAWNGDHARLTGGSSYSAAHRTVSDIVVYSPAHATYQTFMTIDVAYYYPSGDAVFRWSGMCWVDGSSGTSNTGIKFYPASGTIDNARYEIYGIKDS